MSVTGSTGYVLAHNGALIPCTVPGTHVSSARLKFKGSSVVDNWSDYSQSSGSVSFPSPPPGYSLTGGHAQHAVTITANDKGAIGTVSISAPGGSDVEAFDLGPNQSQRIYASTDCSGTGTASGTVSLTGPPGGGMTQSGKTITATTYARKTLDTANPKATVGAQPISGPATLADGVESGWYSITVGNLVPGTNQVAVEVAGSLQVWLEVEYTYDPYPPAPTRHTPENLAVSDDRAQPFEVTLEGAEGSSATQYHAKLVISQSPTLSNPIVADSSQSQVGWERWDGSAWVPLTNGGVPAGGKVRYTPPSPLPLGVLYWTAQTKDNWGYGLVSSIWSLRMVLDVNAQDGYALAINSAQYPCKELAVNPTCGSKVGTVVFVIDNWPDDEGVRNNDRINYGDTVNLSLYDFTGHETQYIARVWQKTPRDTDLVIVAALGDRILTERIVKADYLDQDIGTSLATAVDNYCSPLLSTGIPDPLGITANLPFRGKRVSEMFDEAQSVWGYRRWVETETTDQVVYLAHPAQLNRQGVVIRHGDGVG